MFLCLDFILAFALCPCSTTHNTNIHPPGGIRTRSPSKQAAADPRLRLLGHWDRQGFDPRSCYNDWASPTHSSWRVLHAKVPTPQIAGFISTPPPPPPFPPPPFPPPLLPSIPPPPHPPPPPLLLVACMLKGNTYSASRAHLQLFLSFSRYWDHSLTDRLRHVHLPEWLLLVCPPCFCCWPFSVACCVAADCRLACNGPDLHASVVKRRNDYRGKW